MFQVTNRISVHPEFRDAFEDRFRARKGNLTAEPGFVRNLVLRPTAARPGADDDGVYLVQTLWETREHFLAWTQSESFRAAHAEPPPREWFREKNVLEAHEVAVATELDA